MRIIVCVNQGLDPKTVKISRTREEFDLREAAVATNLQDKIALEAALRLRESEGGEVIAVTVGGTTAEDTAHEAVALGADKGFFVLAPGQLSGRGVSVLTLAAIERLGGADLILAGQGGSLDQIGSLAPRLAAALDRTLLMGVVAFEAGAAGLTALIAGDSAGMRVPVTLPAVAEVAPGRDRPRYPHPARIAIAWNPGMVETWSPADLGVTEETLTPDPELGSLVLPAERQRGQTISGAPAAAAAELVGILRAKRLI